MPATADESAHVAFFGLMPGEFDALVEDWGWPRFRGQQVRRWVYEKLAGGAGEMTNLGKLDRQMLGQRVDFARASVTVSQHSNDGTDKLLLTWPGGANAETVMIPDGPRRTACVSSQVGCPVQCKFCASGISGVKGNLSADQIVEQVFALDRVLEAKEGTEARRHEGTKGEEHSPQSSALSPVRERVNHVVFMGMGEPLANYANVMQAVRILHEAACFNLGARRITISTVGVPAKMRQLAEEELPINLAISLHAPNEALRKELIPWAEHFSLDEILQAARYYFERTGREVTLEYILLSGVNDQPAQARQLVEITRTLRANVNLIRYNEVQGLPFKRPRAEDVVAFQEVLRKGGVNAHVRKSRGRDIDAACGQLRRKAEGSGQ